MTTPIFQEWVTKWDLEEAARVSPRKILLLQDGFSAHVPPDNLQHIRIKTFSPNMTPYVQPMDAGIIANFKLNYRTSFIRRSIDHYDQGISPAHIYNIDQLTAMHMTDKAWCNVNATTIRKCWIKTGILPNNFFDSNLTISVSLPISHLLTSDSTGSSSTLLNAQAHAELEESLDDLVKTGALQPTNQMTVDRLLNPVAEQDDMQQYSDKDIYKAVMEAKEQHETAHLHGGEDDIAASLDDPAEPRPSRSEALHAVRLI